MMKQKIFLVTILSIVLMSVTAQKSATATFPHFFGTQKKMQKGIPLTNNAPVGARSNTITITAPRITFSGNQALLVERSIANTSDSTVCWYFGHMFKNDQEVVDYLRSFITKPYDTALAQRELIAAWFDISKVYFTNNTLIFNWMGDTATFKKEMSVTGFLQSMHNVQCGNFFRHSMPVLIHTGYFTKTDFETIDVPGHSIGQIQNMNRPIFTDFDAGSGFSWNRNPLSPNGYANIDDIRTDTLLIQDYYSHNGKIFVDTNEWGTRSRYRNLLLGNPMYRQIFPHYVEPFNMTAEYRLPAHATIRTELPSMMLALDVADSTSLYTLMAAFDTLTVQYQNGCAACQDTLMMIIAHEFRLTLQDLLAHPIYFVMYNSNTDYGKTFGEVFDFYYERETIPVWTVTGTNTDTVRLGSDLQMPLLILTASNITGEAVLGDTSCIQNGEYHLWDAGDTAPDVTPAMVNYVQSGFIPPSTNWQLDVAVNAHPGMLSPLEDWTLNLECGSDASLVANTVVTFVSAPVMSGLPSNYSPKEDQFVLYPNPAQSVVVCATSRSVPVYDIYGTIVQVFHDGRNDIASLAPGMYFVGSYKFIKL